MSNITVLLVKQNSYIALSVDEENHDHVQKEEKKSMLELYVLVSAVFPKLKSAFNSPACHNPKFYLNPATEFQTPPPDFC